MRRHRASLRSRSILVALLATLVGCGSDSGNPTAPGTNPGGGGGGGGGGNVELTQADREFLPVLLTAGASTSQLAWQAIDIVARAVYDATLEARASAWVTTGTVTQTSSSEFDRLSYAPQPADRLVIQPFNGPSLEVFDLVVREASGVPLVEYEFGGYYVLVDLHAQMDFRLVAGAGELTITSASPVRPGGIGVRNNRQSAYTRTVDGTWTLPDGTEVVFDVDETGQRAFEFVGGSGDDTDESGSASGTLSWDGIVVQIDESVVFQQGRDTSSLDGTPQYTAQVLERRSGSSAVVGGRTLRFDGLRIRSAIRNGVINEPGQWVAEGILRVDGSAAGTVVFARTPAAGLSGLTAELQTEDGNVPLTGATLGG